MGHGIDRVTLRPLSGWPHVEQSIGVILSTRFGERIMREWVGSAVPRLLGESLTEPTLLRFVQAMIIAIEAWEPRFVVRRASYTGTVEDMRAGAIRFALEGDYRPRAHLGDLSVESRRIYWIGEAV